MKYKNNLTIQIPKTRRQVVYKFDQISDNETFFINLCAKEPENILSPDASIDTLSTTAPSSMGTPLSSPPVTPTAPRLSYRQFEFPNPNLSPNKNFSSPAGSPAKIVTNKMLPI